MFTSEMCAIEKLLHRQNIVYCKISTKASVVNVLRKPFKQRELQGSHP